MDDFDGRRDAPGPAPERARAEHTIAELLGVASRAGASSPALIAPGRAPLDFLALRTMVHFVATTLRGIGIERDECVAIALPNGPELAVATLGAASACVALPIAHGTEPANIERQLAMTAPTVLLTQDGCASPAAGIARRLGIQVLEIVACTDAPAGTFAFKRVSSMTGLRIDPARGDQLALLLPDAPPGLAALRHAELLATAEYLAANLDLHDSDRCLCMSSVAGGHGLVGVLLPSIAAGASVICPPHFDSRAFPGWLSTLGPTWYAGPPSVHARVLVEPGSEHARHGLRFIRSFGEPLSDVAAQSLAEMFGVPVHDARTVQATTH